jgi:hypothetical protein
LLAQVLLFDGPQTLGGIGLGIHTMLLGAAASIIGLQVVVYWVISQYVGWLHDVLPTVPRMVLKIAETSLERGLIAGAAIFGVGLLWSAWETSSWIASGFAAREPTLLMRDLIPALSLMVMGVEIVLAALFLSIARLGLRRTALPSSSSQQPACADVKQQA